MANGDTMVRVYPMNNTGAFDRERAQFEREGWEVARIDQRDSRPGCSLPLVGAMMYRPQGELVVTYQKRSG